MTDAVALRVIVKQWKLNYWMDDEKCDYIIIVLGTQSSFLKLLTVSQLQLVC